MPARWDEVQNIEDTFYHQSKRVTKAIPGLYEWQRCISARYSVANLDDEDLCYNDDRDQ